METTTLEDLQQRLRAEVSRSLSPGHGSNQSDSEFYLLARVQRQLYMANDWPNLVREETVSLSAGTRYITTLSTLNYDQINGMWVRYGDTWAPLQYGIGPDQYTAYDSAADERSFPIQRYRYDAGQPGIEVWPIPDQTASVMVRGQKALGNLKDLSDTTTLDADLIVLYAAAEIAASDEHPKAALLLNMAQSHLRALRKNLTSDKKPITDLNGHERKPRARPYLDFIP